jgi:hypothetical protein
MDPLSAPRRGPMVCDRSQRFEVAASDSAQYKVTAPPAQPRQMASAYARQLVIPALVAAVRTAAPVAGQDVVRYRAAAPPREMPHRVFCG